MRAASQTKALAYAVVGVIVCRREMWRVLRRRHVHLLTPFDPLCGPHRFELLWGVYLSSFTPRLNAKLAITRCRCLARPPSLVANLSLREEDLSPSCYVESRTPYDRSFKRELKQTGSMRLSVN